MVVDTFHVDTLQLTLLSGILSDHSEFWCGYRGSFCSEYTFRSDCSHFKALILLGAKLSSPTRCALEEQASHSRWNATIGTTCARLFSAMYMNPEKSPHPLASLNNVDFRPFMFAPFYLKGIIRPPYTWYVLSSLDLNNGCFPSDWHHTGALLSACSVAENRMVKVIWTERCSFMVSRLQPWFVISSPVSLPLVFFFFFSFSFFSLPHSLQSGLHLCGSDTHTHRATYRYAHRSTCAHTHQTDGWSSVLTKAKAQATLGSSKSLRLASRCLFRMPSVLRQTNVT